jgi:hypothetical protein
MEEAELLRQLEEIWRRLERRSGFGIESVRRYFNLSGYFYQLEPSRESDG